MAYNYNKLSGRIVEYFGSQAKFAEALGISVNTMSLRMTGKREWKQGEIVEACKLLEIPDKEISAYFFAVNVQRC